MMFIINKLGMVLLLICMGNQLAHSQTSVQLADFARAVKFDDASEVKSWLKKGVNPNTVDANGSPMLVLAIREKSSKVIDVLLSDKNIDVNKL